MGAGRDMTRILIAVDGSATSARALDYVVRRRKAGESVEALLVHVQPKILPKGRLVTRDMIAEYQAKEAEKVLGKAKIKALQKVLHADAYVESGDPAGCIVAFAKKTKCDEIVIGSRGLGGLSGLFLGSVANKVVQVAPIPVIVVK